MLWAAWKGFLWLREYEAWQFSERIADRKRAIRLQLAEDNEELPEPKRGGYGSNSWTVKKEAR